MKLLGHKFIVIFIILVNLYIIRKTSSFRKTTNVNNLSDIYYNTFSTIFTRKSPTVHCMKERVAEIE